MIKLSKYVCAIINLNDRLHFNQSVIETEINYK